MKQFRADLHVHTVLSPCGDLEMSPANIVEAAVLRNIDILGITDHNSTKHCALIKKMAEIKGIYVLGGAEVTTKEEIHCLTFFENNESLEEFQQYLDTHLPDVKNKPSLFGHQVVVDEEEIIVEQVDKLLISGLNQSIDQVREKVRELGGLFIPAHIDRPSYSLISQLGFVPDDLQADAVEISALTTEQEMKKRFPVLAALSFIGNSDAHHPSRIGERFTLFEMMHPSFSEFALALKGQEGRRVVGFVGV